MDGASYKVTLKAARVNAGLDQEEARKLIGCSKATLVKYESGAMSPTLPVFEKMCRVYKVPMESISFTRNEN